MSTAHSWVHPGNGQVAGSLGTRESEGHVHVAAWSALVSWLGGPVIPETTMRIASASINTPRTARTSATHGTGLASGPVISNFPALPASISGHRIRPRAHMLIVYI